MVADEESESFESKESHKHLSDEREHEREWCEVEEGEEVVRRKLRIHFLAPQGQVPICDTAQKFLRQTGPKVNSGLLSPPSGQPDGVERYKTCDESGVSILENRPQFAQPVQG